MKTSALFIQIPAVGEMPAFQLDSEHPMQVRSLIERVIAWVNLSVKAYEMANDSIYTQATRERATQRELRYAKQVEATMSALGAETYWPGLYPAYKVRGFEEYDTQSAVLAALGHPRNWLKQEGGK